MASQGNCSTALKSEVDFEGTECEGVEWIQVAQDQLRWQALENKIVQSSGSLICMEYCDLPNRIATL